MKQVLSFILMLWTTSAALAQVPDKIQVTEQELLKRTQAMFDAVAAGNKAPWERNIAEDCLYFDEKGRAMDKKALLADLAPLPKGYSGTIKVVKPKSRFVGNTVILSYDLDETESIFGQDLTARYHETDTWMFRGGQWQIVAGQVLRYYEDPAPGKIDPAKLDDFVGEYQLAPDVSMKVTREGDQLYSQRGTRPKELLVPEACDIFFRKGIEGRRLFRRNAIGKVDALIDRRNNQDVVWKKL